MNLPIIPQNYRFWYRWFTTVLFLFQSLHAPSSSLKFNLPGWNSKTCPIDQQQGGTCAEKPCRTLRFEFLAMKWVPRIYLSDSWTSVPRGFLHGPWNTDYYDKIDKKKLCQKECRQMIENDWFSSLRLSERDPCVARDYYCLAKPYALILSYDIASLWSALLCGCRMGIVIDKAYKEDRYPRPFDIGFGYQQDTLYSCKPQDIVSRLVQSNGKWSGSHFGALDGRPLVSVIDENVSCKRERSSDKIECFCDKTGYDNCGGRYEPGPMADIPGFR